MVAAFGLLPAAVTLLASAFLGSSPIIFGQEAIRTLWQVQASILGLSIALTVFGLEVVSRTGIALITAMVTRPFMVGLRSGLVVTTVIAGAVFIETPNWAWATWFGVAAVLLSLVWFVVVAIGIGAAVQAASPGMFTRLSSQALEEAATEQAREDAIAHFSQLAIRDIAVELGAEADSGVLALPGDVENQLIRSSQGGRLRDVNLVALRSALSAARSIGNRLTFSMPLGKSVQSRQVLARSDVEIVGQVRSQFLASADFTDQAAPAGLQELLDYLHRVAFDALLAGRAELQSVLGGYEAGLKSYARIWTRAVEALTPDLVESGLGWDRSPVGSIRQSLARMIQAGPRAPAVDDVYNLAYFPIRIARRAIEWQAPVYFQLLSLYPLMYRAGYGTPRTGASEALLDRSWRYLTEVLWIVIPSMVRTAPAPIDIVLLREARAATRESLVQLIFATIETGDLDTFTQAFSAWEQAET